MSALQNNLLGTYNPNDFLENIDIPPEEIDEHRQSQLKEVATRIAADSLKRYYFIKKYRNRRKFKRQNS